MMFSSILTSLSVLALLGGSNAIPTPDKDTLAPRGYCQDNLGLVGGTFDVFIRLNIDMQGDISTPNPAKWSNSIGYSSKASFLTKCDIYEQRPVPDSTMYFKSRDTGACWHCTVSGVAHQLDPPWSYEAISPDYNPQDPRYAGVSLQCNGGW